jgi:hypothetical protein
VVQPGLVREGRLVEVIPDWRFRAYDLSLVHVGKRHIIKPCRLFKDLAAQMAQVSSRPSGLTFGSSRADAAHVDDRGGVMITLDHKSLDRMTTLRGSGESCSDVILRLAKGDAGEGIVS